MRFQISLFVLLLCGSTIFGQDCSSGQCRVPVRNTVRALVQPVSSVVRAVAQPQSANCPCINCQCSAGGVGSLDYDGAVITSVGVVSTNTVSAAGFKQRKKSRQVIVEAAEQAHAQCLIDSAELQAIKLASRSPRMLARMEDLILEKAASSGAYSFAMDENGDFIKSAIDWEAIGDFILKIAPLIFKLIEMFVVNGANNFHDLAVSRELNFHATIQRDFQLAI